MDLRDKLRIYEKKKESAPAPDTGNFLAEAGGELIDQDGTRIWRFVSAQPLASLAPHGHVPADIGPILRHGGIKVQPALEDLLFLDLETTSLSTGAGSYAFLIGAGYARGESFITELLFMDDYSREPVILRYLLGLLSGAKALVTFNGRTFDVPLIKTRYRLNRVQGFPVDIPNMDLLYACRSLFRGMYEGCSLKIMEERVLGFAREGDVPGWIIPEIFFSYQKHGETERLPAVIEHNRMDVVSMVKIFFLVNATHHAIETGDVAELDRRVLVNVASRLYSTDLHRFLELAAHLGREEFLDRSLFKKYGTALKRAGRMEEALRFWRNDQTLHALEELAKHAEHRERKPSDAADLCAKALALIERSLFSERDEPLTPVRASFYRERFMKRMERVRRKMG